MIKKISFFLFIFTIYSNCSFDTRSGIWTQTENIKKEASLEIEDFKTMAPLNAKVDTAVNTTILPGHHYGYKKSITIEDNIKISKFFQCQNLKEFISVMKKFESTFNK